MNKQRTIRRTLLAIAIAAFGASGTALADPEVESNNNFGQPQKLEVGAEGIVTVFGAINNPSESSPDVDYYSFEGQAGETITVDIDGTTGDLDTILYVFDPTGVKRFTGQDTEPLDAGSNPYAPGADATFDPSLKFTLDKPGTWKIAVVSWPALLLDNGAWKIQKAQSNGPYTLIVSGLKPSIEQMQIDIKPGSPGDALINLKAKGTIPVVLLSSSGFNPFEVDVASLKFGRLGTEASLSRCNKEGGDLNGDGVPDRMCHFDNEKTGFTRVDTVGVLKGTRGGKAFEGRGDLKVLPQKRGD
jgi:hypothetical protein